MRLITRVIDRITTGMAVVAGVAVVLMIIQTTISIVFRAGFNYALVGTITFVSNYYMVIVVCLPLAFVERSDAHISVDVLTNHFARSVQTRLFGWTYLLSAAVFALVAYASWQEAVAKYDLGLISVEGDVAIPTWIGYFAVPLGYGMGTVYALLRFVRFMTGQPQYLVARGIDSQVERLGHD